MCGHGTNEYVDNALANGHADSEQYTRELPGDNVVSVFTTSPSLAKPNIPSWPSGQPKLQHLSSENSHSHANYT